MEQKSNNTTVVVIAFAVIVIVAMLCGMVMWIFGRQMSLNERLLEVRLVEAQQAKPSAAPQAPAVLPQAATMPAPQAPTTPAPSKPEAEAKPSPKPPAKTPTKPAAATAPATPTKRKAPKELQAAKVGPDGRPLDRILLPVGKEDLDWQF